MKPHIYWSAGHQCYKCILGKRQHVGRGHSPREAYHAFMLANGFRLKETEQ